MLQTSGSRGSSQCGAGFLIKTGTDYFKKALDKPARPFVAIVGGSKVSGKFEAVGHLIRKVDKMIIGGGMAFTFLKAQGYDVGKSLVEDDLIGKAMEVMKRPVIWGLSSICLSTA